CQFEQQLRSVCGLPLGSTRQIRPAAMVNLLGDLWHDNAKQIAPQESSAENTMQWPPLNWPAALSVPETRLHLYGKREPRRKRKMGHITSLGDTPEQAKKRALEARGALIEGGSMKEEV